MEVAQRPPWTDGVFYAVGVLASAIFIIRLLHHISIQLRLYLLPKICRQKDFVSLYGKWAVITGGSDGIGKYYSMELAKRGMNICIISNYENNIVQDIKSRFGVHVKWIDIDFSSSEVYDQIEKELSQLDDIGILVNNVGTINLTAQPLAKTDRKFLMKILNVNVTSMMLMTELVLKKMVQKNRGLIVNMCSLSARFPLPYFTVYSSTKGFIENYSACLASELSGAKSNVRVKCLEPLFVKTRLVKGVPNVTKFLERTPLLSLAIIEAPTFAASAADTFGIETPLIYSGYWTHELCTHLLLSLSLPKTIIVDIVRWLTVWLKSA